MIGKIYSNATTASVNNVQAKILLWIEKIKNWLLPGACLICGAASSSIDLCQPCEHDLPWLENSCSGCALPLSPNVSGQLCGSCIQRPPPYAKTIALFSYQAPIDRLIMGLKFHNKLSHAALLSKLMIKRLSIAYRNESLPDLIIPVPLHPHRLRERGYNQTVELARPLAKHFKIPIDFKSCQRIRSTLAQTELPAADRQANIKNAFLVTRKIANCKHVAILDDVITTGHTILELSKNLRKAGIEQIDIWCCARTLQPNRTDIYRS